MENTEDSSYQSDIDQLGVLAERVSSISPDQFSKYQKLVDVIQASDWTGKKTDDRLVIFTERIETLRFLEKHLPSALGLKDKQLTTLYGSLSDVEQQSIVERFGREADSLRLLIASDVASEGINLHYLCHRMIHFDIPWSLMVFQQRNGRIDRYGQTETPQITYLITQSDTPKIKGDLRILELLTEKDDQVVRNIGDPSEFTGIYDRDEEELKTATAMEDNVSAEEFEQQIEQTEVDPLAILLGDMETTISHSTEEAIAHMPTLFPSTFDYFRRGLEFVGRELKLQHDIDEGEQVISLTVPAELEQRLRFLPPEIEIKGDQIALTADRAKIQQEIARCRKEDSEWPQLHLLWEQHPVAKWINDKVLAAFHRHEAPVLVIPDRLKLTESIFIVSGLIPNQKGHPLIHPWFGLRYRDGAFDEELDLDDVIRITGLGKATIPQTFGSEDDVDLSELRKLLPTVVETGRAILTRERTKWRDLNDPKLQKHLDRLDELRKRRHTQLESGFQGELSESRQSRRDAEHRRIDKLFDEYWDWIEQTMTTEDRPYLRIAAVLWGGG